MAYALVKIKKSSTTLRLTLPFTIGSSSKSTIFINTGRLDHVSKIIGSHNSKLVCVDVKTQTQIDDNALNHYGINVLGLVKHGTAERVSWKSRMIELLLHERMWFESIPLLLQKYLGGSWSQTVRLCLWCGTISFLFLSTLGISRIYNQAKDKSQEITSIKYGKSLEQAFGSIPSNREQAKGIYLKSNIPKNQMTFPHLLSFEAKGLDFPRELEVILNGQRIYEYRMNNSCIFDYCTLYIPITEQKNPQIMLVIRHNNLKSDYIVRNILLSSRPKILEQEIHVLQTRFNLANRAFNEREIASENILISRRELTKILNFTARKSGAKDIRSKAWALRELVEEQTTMIIKSLKFSAERNYKLANFTRSLEEFQKLSKFYPDPSSKERQEIRKRILQIKELI